MSNLNGQNFRDSTAGPLGSSRIGKDGGVGDFGGVSSNSTEPQSIELKMQQLTQSNRIVMEATNSLFKQYLLINERIKSLDEKAARLDDLDKRVDQLGNLTERVKGFESLKKEIDAEIDKVKSGIEDQKKKAYEGLTIFVAFFTFISVDFQFFKEMPSCVWSGLGIVLLTAGLLLLFVLAFEFVLFSGANDAFLFRCEDGGAVVKGAEKGDAGAGTKQVWTKNGILLVSSLFVSFMGAMFFIVPVVYPSACSQTISGERKSEPGVSVNLAPQVVNSVNPSTVQSFPGVYSASPALPVLNP